jgi:hypothetical protein
MADSAGRANCAVKIESNGPEKKAIRHHGFATTSPPDCLAFFGTGEGGAG